MRRRQDLSLSGAAALALLCCCVCTVRRCACYLLDCEADKPASVYTSRRYLPNLVTLSRLDGGRYTVDLRCQGMTLEGTRIQKDFVHVKLTVNWTGAPALASDDHFAKYTSMSCGGACFNPAITERDLLTGRVCMAAPGRSTRRCRQTEIRVEPGGEDGYGDDGGGASSSAGVTWVLVLLVVANVAGVVVYFVYRRKKAKKSDVDSSDSDSGESHENTKMNSTGVDGGNPKIVVTATNHNDNRKVGGEDEDVDEIKYASEYS